MTNTKNFLFLSALLIALSGQAQGHQHEENAAEEAITEAVETIEEAACEMPIAPIIPDGNVASESELVAAQKAMKMFQESLVTYRECLHALEKEIDPEAESAVADGEAILNNYNSSVDAEEKVAAEFNDAVKAFKSRQN